MDYLKNNLNENYILIGENNEGKLLSLKSTNLYGNIDIYTQNTFLSLMINNSSVTFHDNNSENSFSFDIANQTIINNNSNNVNFIVSEFVGQTSTDSVFDYSDEILKSKEVFEFQNEDDIFAFVTETKILQYSLSFNHSFHLIDGSIVNTLSGVGFYFKTTQDEIISIDSFSIHNKDNVNKIIRSRPYHFSLFAKSSSYYIEIFKSSSGLPDNIDNYSLYTTRKGIYSSEFILIVFSISLIPNLHDDDLENTRRYENGVPYYLVDFGYLDIKIENDVKINFNIDFNNNSIGNIQTIKTENIILNGNLYDKILTINDISQQSFDIIHTNELFLNGVSYTSLISALDDSFFKLNNYTNTNTFRSLFKPNTFYDIEKQNYIIPFILNGGDDDNIVFMYDKDITTKHIKQLKNLSQGLLLIDSNNDIVSSYNFDNLFINKIDTTFINSTYVSTDNISINSNILSWNSSIDRFQYNDTLIQPQYFNVLSDFPPYISNVTFINSNIVEQFNGVSSYNTLLNISFIDPNLPDDIHSFKISSINPENVNSIDNDFGNFKNLIINNFNNFSFIINNFNEETGRLITYQNNYIKKINNIEFSDIFEYEFSHDIFVNSFSFSLIKNTLFPLDFYIFAFNGIKWEQIFHNTDIYDIIYNKDIFFYTNSSKMYKRFSFGVSSIFKDPSISDFVNICSFRNFKFHGYKQNHIGKSLSLDKNIDLVNFDRLYINNHNSIDNQINKNINKVIINPDFYIDDYVSTISTFHINSFQINDNFNNLLRFSIIDQNNLNNHNTVVHQIGIRDYTTIYNIHTTDTFDNTISNDPQLSITNKKIGINCIPDVYQGLNDTEKIGLFIKGDITLYNSANNSFSFQINPNLVDDYTVILPQNIGDIDSYLRIHSIENNNAYTSWKTLDTEFLIDKNIYIGNSTNSNIHSRGYSFSNNDIPVFLTHINKLLVGTNDLPDEFNINKHTLSVSGSIYASNDIFTDSDISYKNNFCIIEKPLDKISKLNGYTFNRNDTSLNQRFTGLIAQEVEKVFPEVIIKKHDDKLRVMYGNLAGLFVEAFKELKKEIDELKNFVYSK